MDTRGITGRLTARLAITGPTASPVISLNGSVASSAGSVELDGTVDGEAVAQPVPRPFLDQRLGFAADLENRNIFGRGASAKLSLRLRQDQQVGRFSVGAQRFLGLPIRSTVFIERAREQLSSDATSRTTASTSTFAGEQAYRIRPGMELRYGYGFERNHTFIRSEQIDSFDLTVNIARFTTSGLVDRRDDAFNPARGWFTASTLELSAPAIGSYLSFLQYVAQISDFIPLDRGMVIASGLRVGLAHTAEDVLLIPTERFYAGGANSVRGYREDDLGARSSLDDAEGGSACGASDSSMPAMSIRQSATSPRASSKWEPVAAHAWTLRSDYCASTWASPSTGGRRIRDGGSISDWATPSSVRGRSS